MAVYADELFEWKPGDLTKKPAIVNNAIKQLRECLDKRNMV